MNLRHCLKSLGIFVLLASHLCFLGCETSLEAKDKKLVAKTETAGTISHQGVKRTLLDERKEKLLARKGVDEEGDNPKDSKEALLLAERERSTRKTEEGSEDKENPDLVGSQNPDDVISIAVYELVRRLQEGIPQDKKINIFIRPFTSLDGRITYLSKLLTEELTTQLSLNPQVGNSINICCNPPLERIGPSTGNPVRLDGVLSGTIARLDENIKVNVRLISIDSRVLMCAASTSIPWSEGLGKLLDAEISEQVVEDRSTLDVQLDSLVWQIEQILKDFQVEKELKLYQKPFATLGGEVNYLGRYLKEECITRLLSDKDCRMITDETVNQFLAKKGLTSADIGDPTVMQLLSEQLGIHAVITGNVVELANTLKVNARVFNTVVGLAVGTASVEIPKDDTVKYLLASAEKLQNKTLASSTAFSPTMPVAITAGGVGVSTEDMFFKEDLSGEDVSKRILEWGDKLVVLKEGDGRPYLSASSSDYVTVKRNLDFPTNFSFELEIKGNSKFWNALKFVDAKGNEFGLDFQLLDENFYLVLPGPKSVKSKVDTKGYNKLRVIRKKEFYEIYINNDLAIAGSYSKYEPFKSFSLVSRLDQFRIYNFVGKIVKD